MTTKDKISVAQCIINSDRQIGEVNEKVDIMNKKLDAIYRRIEQAHVVGGNRGANVNANNNRNHNLTVCNFTIKNMSDAQAKDLLMQGLTPNDVSVLSNLKFSVQYLISLQNNLRR